MSENNNRPEDQQNFRAEADSMREDAKSAAREAKSAYREARYDYRRERRGDGLGVGLTFIFIGIVWMLLKLGYINFSIIGAVIDLWPLIFVVIGVNILFRRVAYIGLLTWVGFLTAIVAYGIYFQPQDVFFNDNGIQNELFGNQTNGTTVTSLNTLSDSIPLEGNEKIKEGNLSLNFGTGNVTMGVSKNNLVDYVIPENVMNTEFNLEGNTADINFSEKNNLNLSRMVRNQLNYDVFLSDKIQWYMNINMGAADCKLNLSEVPVRELEINGGAGDFDLALSDLTDKTNVSLNMAAGDAKLEVPKSVGLRISTNGIVSDNNFTAEGLTKVDGDYVTPGIETAQKVIEIEVNSAASGIKLTRK